MLAYALGKSLLFNLAEMLNEESKGKNVTATVIVPSTIDTAINRKAMPDVNPEDWVKPEQLAEILEFVISEKGSPLRETVLKVYSKLMSFFKNVYLYVFVFDYSEICIKSPRILG